MNNLVRPAPGEVTADVRRLVDAHLFRISLWCDRRFAVLLVTQWVAGIVTAGALSPLTWTGGAAATHPHLYAAVWLGLAINVLPLVLIATRPGQPLTRHVIAAAQMATSALLIDLSGGRIEMHFHIFGSLAFLAFYRDWRVLVTATAVVMADHLVRGAVAPASVFGVPNAGWRWAEHGAWVLFEDVFLVMHCVRGRQEMAEIARRQSDVESAVAMARADREDLLTALNAGTIVCMTDGDWRITYANDRYCAASGYARFELMGRHPELLHSTVHTDAFWAEVLAVVGTGGLWTGEICNRDKDGRHYWSQASIKGLLGPGGTLRRVVNVQHEITEQKAAAAHRVQAQRLESIGQLAAGIAHEINTPTQFVGDNVRFLKEQFAALLGVVNGYAGLLDPAAGGTPWDARRQAAAATLESLDFPFLRAEIPAAIDQSLEGLARVSSIVLAMREFSHPGSTTREPADLNRSIASTIEVCRNRWKYVADVETAFAADLPRVPCLVAELNQVVLNLVVNAADAIAERSHDADQPLPRGVIRVATRVVGDEVEIAVADNGLGMSESVQRHLFEPFFTTKPVGKGTGQGLALSREVVTKKHGGRLTFESALGAGTTFRIFLPLGGPDGEPGAAAGEPLQLHAAPVARLADVRREAA